MSKSSLKSKNWLIWITILLTIAILAGIFLYHYFLRRPHAQLIETVPPSAEFIIQVNDNDLLVKNITPILSPLNELLHLQALQGIEFFIEQFPKSQTGYILSGHSSNETTKLLMSCKIEERNFTHLLKRLKIDARNYTSYGGSKIYTYGTHYKKFYFTCHNKIFSVAEDIETLKSCINILKNSSNLLSNKNFTEIYAIVNKNPNQNWLILNHESYFSSFDKLLSSKYHALLTDIKETTLWSAYQMHIHNFEIMLSGYALLRDGAPNKIMSQNAPRSVLHKYLPGHTNSYIAMHIQPLDLLKTKVSDKHIPQGYFELIQNIQPVENYYFTIREDTSIFTYTAFKCDTTQMNLAAITSDSIASTTHRNFIIRATNIGENPSFWNFNHTQPLNFYTQYHDIIIFSDSIAPLKRYINAINNNTIETNPYYRYTQNSMPTNNSYELFVSFAEKEEWYPYFAPEAHTGALIKNLKIFSVSNSDIHNNLLSTNIFIKF